MNAVRQRCYRFLTREDYQLLSEKSTRKVYEPEAHILREGSQSHALYIVRKGSVRVEVDRMSETVEVDRLEEGEFLGVMSFLDDSPMGATLVANDTVEVDYLDSITMHALLSSVPGFSSRFYLTLAVILSSRMREVMEKMPFFR